GVIRLNAQRLSKALDGRLQPVQVYFELPTLEVCVRICGVDPYRRVVVLDRILGQVHARQSVRQVVVGDRKIRAQQYGLCQALDGLIGPLRALQSEPQVAVRGRKAGVNPYRLPEVLDRLIGPSRAVQTDPKIVVREVVPGRDIERVPEQREV